MRLSDGSRMSGDIQVRFCESVGVRLPHATLLCIFMKDSTADNAVKLKEDIARFLLSTTGLELSPEKTLITDAGNGINFLGFRIARTDGDANGVRAEIITDKLQAFKEKVDEAIEGLDTPDTLNTGIGQINNVVRGWGQHARLADNFPAIAEELDDYLTDRIVQLICRVKGKKRKQCRVVHGRKGGILIDGHRLDRLFDLDVIREVRPPKPYRPK